MNGHARLTFAVLALCVGFLIPAARAADEKTGEEITVRVVSPKEFKAAIEKHRGQVVLVDYWATWCVPCLKGFPHTVALHREYAGKGLVVISMSMDDADEDTKAQALKFLKAQKATFPNLMSQLGGEEEAMKSYGVPNGALPHYKLFDRQGRQIAQFGVDPAKELSHKDIEAAVQKALAAR
jgi:thiol-disulfide isomerase/thioredoxin